jgi:hypothetical protein
MKSSILFPCFLIKNARRKKRADLLIVEAAKNKGKEILKAPALIVKTLNGIGVNPAVKVMIRPYRSYLVFILRNTASLNPGI